MILRPLVKGIISFIPGIRLVLPKPKTGGTDSPLYCYEQWMKHLTMLWASGMRHIPNSLVELGPGDSLGVGLAAVLSGINNYVALDVVEYSDNRGNMRMLDELIQLFRDRAGRPAKGWPDYDQYLDARLFPSHILTDQILSQALSETRITMIREMLANPENNAAPLKIKYLAPWSDNGVIPQGTADIIISHSVLEHVEDLESIHRAFGRWLKAGGFFTHQIDLTSHEASTEWNRHWAYSQGMWKIILGKRSYFINRLPCSAHLKLIKQNGFKIVCCHKRYRQDGITRSQLAADWQHLSDDDLTCSGLFIQAQKN
jgi:hypothetical protein